MGPLAIDPDGYAARRSTGGPLNLARREFELLALLAASPGQVFTAEQIYDRRVGQPLRRLVDGHRARAAHPQEARRRRCPLGADRARRRLPVQPGPGGARVRLRTPAPAAGGGGRPVAGPGLRHLRRRQAPCCASVRDVAQRDFPAGNAGDPRRPAEGARRANRRASTCRMGVELIVLDTENLVAVLHRDGVRTRLPRGPRTSCLLSSREDRETRTMLEPLFRDGELAGTFLLSVPGQAIPALARHGWLGWLLRYGLAIFLPLAVIAAAGAWFIATGVKPLRQPPAARHPQGRRRATWTSSWTRAAPRSWRRWRDRSTPCAALSRRRPSAARGCWPR